MAHFKLSENDNLKNSHGGGYWQLKDYYPNTGGL